MPAAVSELIDEGYTDEQALAVVQEAGETQRVEDFNGWFEVPRNPISRVGVFPYLGSSLGEELIAKLKLDPEQIYMVFRGPEALSDPEFIDSVKLIPWVDDHTMLGSEESGNTPAEQKGVGGTTGEQVEFDAETGILYSNIKCFSEAHRTQVDSGKRQLSLGYRCKYMWAPGEYNGQPFQLHQIELRGNHLASVLEGRMGPGIAVLDHDDTKGKSAMDEIKKLLAALMEAIGKLDGDAPKPDDVVVEDEEPEVKVEAKDEDPEVEVKAEDEEPEVKVEAKDEDPEVEVKAEDEEPVVTAEAMDAAVEKRVLAKFQDVQRGAALAAKLKGHVGVFDHAGKGELAVAKYGLKKLGITAPAGQEIGAIAGYLKAKGDPSKAPVVSGVGQDSAVPSNGGLIGKKLAGGK